MLTSIFQYYIIDNGIEGTPKLYSRLVHYYKVQRFDLRKFEVVWLYQDCYNVKS